MIDWLAKLPRARGFWFSLAVFALFLEGAALVYQYVLGYLPCVICIHVRLLVAGCFMVWLVSGFTCHSSWARRIAMFLSLLLSAALAERSWQLLATENGWTVGSCEMTLGMPAWMAVDQWWPWMFEIHEPCGYTPYIIAKISMAEVLMVMSIPMVLSFALLALLAWMRPQPSPLLR